MRRIFALAFLFVLCLGTMVVTNCSSPLEASSAGEPGPPIIVTITDTIVDTLIQSETDTLVDTLIQSDVDTLFVVDTLVDTVYVEMPDTSTYETICSKLSKCKKELIWELGNTAGNYQVEITIHKYDDRHPKDLLVTIEGIERAWTPNRDDVMRVKQALSANARVSVKRDSPHGWGHSAKLCITITRLN